MLTLSPPGDTGRMTGWDGCALVLDRNDGLYRYRPAGYQDATAALGLTPFWRRNQVLGIRDLIGFPRGASMEILDLRTGKHFRASGLALDHVPVPPWQGFGPLPPESGYVALQIQSLPQVIYQIAPVTPVRPYV